MLQFVLGLPKKIFSLPRLYDTTPVAVIPKNMQLFDLLEAVKHSKGEGVHGPNCTI